MRATRTRWGLSLALVGACLLAGLPAAGQGPDKAKDPAKPADLKQIAAAIAGYRFEFPCKDAMPETPKPGADCASGLVKGDPKKTDNFSAQKKFGGTKGKRYKVTLRFRGVV